MAARARREPPDSSSCATSGRAQAICCTWTSGATRAAAVPGNVPRALHRAQERARTPNGKPTFPDLFEHDEQGDLVIKQEGKYVLRRREAQGPAAAARLPRSTHTAATDSADAEEAGDLLRHKSSNVTQAIHRGDFNDKRRELLRARLEARRGSAEEAPDRDAG